MTRYTLMLFQSAYPDQIEIYKCNKDNQIYTEFWLLNEDKEPHSLLISGNFKTEADIESTIKELLNIKLDE